MRAFAELSEDGKRINLHFPYSYEAKEAVKAIGGARFVGPDKGGPHWSLPLELQTAKQIRSVFNSSLELGAAIKEWGKKEVEKARKLGALVAADDVPLEEMKLYAKLPEFAGWLRAYQRADVSFMGTTSALNLNEPRLGKTTEIIAAVYEGDLENGPHLIVAPQKSLETVWRMEIERWTPGSVYTYSGDHKDSIEGFYNDLDHIPDWPRWWVTTADMIRRGQFPDIEWETFTVDEYHKTGLLRASGVNDPKKNSVFVLACRAIKAERRFALSGTPIGGKAIKLWSGLNFIAPEVFTGKWRWAQDWLEVVEEDGQKVIGGLREERKTEFDAYHRPYIVRRLRIEVLPQLPPKLLIPVWCEMGKAQRKQYESFAADLEVRIDEHRVAASNVLAEYTRLKQFSNSLCSVEVIGVKDDGETPELKVHPTEDSGKLPYLLERLAEEGIDPDDPAGSTQAIVSSQFRLYIEMVSRHLDSKGIKNVLLTGASSKKDSELAQRAFKAGNDNEGLRVCCMVTTMGVGLTLDNVTSVHLLDETWTPDDQEQLSDRAVNTTLNHQVSVLTYRSLLSVEEEIYKENAYKAWTNQDVLDARRRGFRATHRGE